MDGYYLKPFRSVNSTAGHGSLESFETSPAKCEISRLHTAKRRRRRLTVKDHHYNRKFQNDNPHQGAVNLMSGFTLKMAKGNTGLLLIIFSFRTPLLHMGCTILNHEIRSLQRTGGERICTTPDRRSAKSQYRTGQLNFVRNRLRKTSAKCNLGLRQRTG